MDIDMMYIDIRSVLEVLKHLQGRVWPIEYFFI
jgi:hypothetical protein